MAKAKIGVLILNLGTPDSPNVGDVRKYLREFLMDWRVIDIPFVQRWALVNLIIAPFRAFKSSKVYKQLWTKQGSPLKIYGEEVVQMLQTSLGESYKVVLGMRYQSPSTKTALEELKNIGLEKIIVFPLYPQYASASTGSSIEEVMKVMKDWEVIPNIEIISQFPDEEKMVALFAKLGKQHLEKESFDHFLFTYHGLPERQIIKASCNNYCQLDKCCQSFNSQNRFCYRAQCFHTSRLLAKELGLTEEQYTVSFQSRLGKTPWIKPYTDEVIPRLVNQGHKKILAFSPSFVADCLETTIEIGEEYKELFEHCGGERWQMVESLNNHPDWISCLKDMVVKRSSL
jgi:protoporphyrin/coproporphyrin ferrochelatase